MHDGLTALRYNPLGLQQYYTVSWRRRLFDRDGDLFADTYLQVGPTIALSPAFVKPGVQVKARPLAVLELTAIYRPQIYFGTFDQILTFDDPAADWSDSGITARGDEARARAGHQLSLTHRLQAAVWKLAVRNTTRWEYNAFPLAADELAFYDQTPDMLVPNDGWVAANDLDLIFLAGALKVGARWTRTVPFFGDGDAADNTSDRVGPLIAVTVRDRPGAVVANPTVLLLTQWHAAHRFRTGEDVPTGLPYLALAFLFDGDLRPW